MKIIFLSLLIATSTCNIGCQGQIQGRKEEIPNEITTIEEKQKRDLQDKIFLPTQHTGVDFRFAARKVTSGVVHINSTWKSAENQNEIKKYFPFKDLFGDDWFRFFDQHVQPGPIQGSASGVILTRDGYIVTNNHVVQGADEIEVVLNDQRSYKGNVIGTDPKTDLALIKIDETNLAFIEIGNSDEVEVGEWVLAVGNPFNLASTVTAGIVSAKARNINILKDREAVESFIQTDAAVNPGNSGGALVDLNGKLIGINSAIATPTGVYAGYSFAIPVNIVKKIADDLLTYGKVKRAYLGVIVRDMTGPLAKEKKLNFISGVYVDSLLESGAAKESGIKTKDIITKIDGITIETTPQLQEIVVKHHPGENLEITLVRNGEQKTINVTLKESDMTIPVIKRSEESILNILGIEVQELTTKEKHQYGIENGLKVTRISEGKIQDFTNIKTGFIIIKVDGQLINTKEDLISIIEDKKGVLLIEGLYPGSTTVYYFGFGI